MGLLSIRCFGGLGVARGEEPVGGFESRKVRALLAYLIRHRDRALARDHIAAMLWPEKNERDARRNLRQALYNLRNVLSGAKHGDATPIFTHQGGVRLSPELACWVDVEAFESILQKGLDAPPSSPHELAAAVRLYRGDFLADLSLDASSLFEDWLVGEREQLREGMVGALRTLIESYLQRGEFRLGIQFAQRLVSMDPLAEEAHRYLIRLFALSGRRRRALDQYHNLKHLLERDLGVEPLEETQRLYQTILAERSPLPLANEEGEPIGPLVPLVGRTRAFGSLTRDWQAMLRGEARFSLIEGEMGIGKTRLARSFLDAASGHREVTILTGRCLDIMPRAYQPFGRALRTLLEDEHVAERVPASASRLTRWLPELANGPDAAQSEAATQEEIFDAVTDLLDAQIEPASAGRPLKPLVLFLDDIHSATSETLDLAAHLIAKLADRPLWLLATSRSGSDIEGRMRAAAERCGGKPRLTALRLDHLDRSAMREVAAWLLGAPDAEPLTELLVEHTGGLPFHIAELVNFLWDQDALVTAGGGRWRLAISDPATLGVGHLRRMLGKRLARLPFSTRRLATLAAVIGQEFEPELIRRTADEHPAVVEVGLEIMLERWILRQNADRWTSNRQRDIVLWTQGARKGRFDFSHRHTREVIYGSVSEGRRRLIHGQVAEALEEIHGAAPDSVCDQLAFHFEQAGDWQRAERYAEHAASRARALFAGEVARLYDAMARRVREYQVSDPLAAQRVEPETGAVAVP